MYVQDFYDSPLGQIRLVADDAALRGLYFVGQKYDLRGFEEIEFLTKRNAVLEQVRAWLDAYFQGAQPDSQDIPLAFEGTAFQVQVWHALKSTPYGQTWTYGDLAEKLSCKSARAIGTAVGKNPISLILPCHRVVGKNGNLTGYAGGLERKTWLLEHENRKKG